MKVPNGFQNRTAYKVFQTLFNTLCFFGKFLTLSCPSKHPTLLRKWFDHFNPNPYLNENDNITVKNDIFDDVPVRLYLPKTDNQKLPVLIFYHGGGYVFGSIDSYDYYTYVLAKKLDMMVISVGYKRSPEHSYPVPVDDCLKATDYIINNVENLKIDPKKIILIGDSAGGNIVLYIIQNFLKMNKKLPLLQILIYPWLQHVNFSYPSYLRNQKTTCYALTGLRCILWYLGIREITKEMEDVLSKSQHLLLINDINLRSKYINYLSIDHIPDIYKQKNYENHKNVLASLENSKLSNNNILIKNKNFANSVIKLFDTNLSPLLLDDEILKKFPETYFIICESDEFKDENLIFAERLKKNNVKINIDYCEDGYHGMITDISDDYLNINSLKLLDNMIKFIKSKVDLNI